MASSPSSPSYVKPASISDMGLYSPNMGMNCWTGEIIQHRSDKPSWVIDFGEETILSSRLPGAVGPPDDGHQQDSIEFRNTQKESSTRLIQKMACPFRKAFPREKCVSRACKDPGFDSISRLKYG